MEVSLRYTCTGQEDTFIRTQAKKKKKIIHDDVHAPKKKKRKVTIHDGIHAPK